MKAALIAFVMALDQLGAALHSAALTKQAPETSIVTSHVYDDEGNPHFSFQAITKLYESNSGTVRMLKIQDLRFGMTCYSLTILPATMLQTCRQE